MDLSDLLVPEGILPSLKAKSKKQALQELASKDILGGLDLSVASPELGNALLVCATETKTESDLDAFIAAVEEIFSTEAGR